MVPLISSLCQGPLGVCQLPRTWWKTLTRQVGRLDAAYPDCSHELDDWCLRALQLDRERVLTYARDQLPTYVQFEAYVLEQAGGRLDPARVDRWNDGVRNRVHVNPGKIDETYPDIGFDPNEVRITSAVILNCMQDWALLYRNDLTPEGTDLQTPVIPLISSVDAGPLGVMQLPRTWLKVSLKARGLLHPDYPDFGGGLDSQVIEAIGLDESRTLDFLRSEKPSYLTFEKWVGAQTRIDRGIVDDWHMRMLERQHPDARRAEILDTVGIVNDGTIASGVLLNHLEDWHLAHAALIQQHRGSP